MKSNEASLILSDNISIGCCFFLLSVQIMRKLLIFFIMLGSLGSLQKYSVIRMK